MSTLNQNVQDILDQIDGLSESEYNQLLDELIEKEPDFQDIHDRLVDEMSTRIPELPSLRPQAKIMRNIKIISLLFFEYVDKGLDEVKKQMIIKTSEGEWLDEHGSDAVTIRNALAKATGKILVGSDIAPDSTYTLPELFAVGTKASESEESIRFLGLTTPSVDPSTPQDIDGHYTVELDIQAENGGSAGNLSLGLITEIFTKVPYFNLVKQKIATTGGFDRETDDSYRERIFANKQEIAPNSIPWFQNQVLDNFPDVQDVQVITLLHGEGTVGLFIRGVGVAVSQSLIDDIQVHFNTDLVKPLANWRVFVYAIETYLIDIQMDVYWKTGFPVLESDLQTATLNYFSAFDIGGPFVLQKMETQIGLVTNVFNFKTTFPTQDIIEPPSVNTLIILGTAVFTLIEVT